MVQAALAKLGITVRLNILEWTIFSQDQDQRNFEAAVGGWAVALKVDLTPMFHSPANGREQLFNFVSYHNPLFDRLNDLAKMTLDRGEARQLWHQAVEVILEDQPYTFLFVPKQLEIIHRRFENVRLEPTSWYYHLNEWYISEANTIRN